MSIAKKANMKIEKDVVKIYKKRMHEYALSTRMNVVVNEMKADEMKKK